MAVTTKATKILICRGANSDILNCQGQKKDTDFYDSWSIWDGDKTAYCKNCLNKMFDVYLKQSGSDKVALYYTLMQVNIPFIQEVYDTLNKRTDKYGNKMQITVNKYITELQKNTAKKMIWKDFSNTNVSLNAEDKVDLVKNEPSLILKKTWGIQEDDEDYEFLENTFERYTEGIEFVNQQQIDLYRDLCRDRLLLRKINDNRYNGEETIDKVQSRIAKTMSTLKVDQFEKKKSKTDIERILEKQIWEIENTEPAELVNKEEYKDFLDIGSNWGKHILRAVRNLVANSKEYPKVTREENEDK